MTSRHPSRPSPPSGGNTFCGTARTCRARCRTKRTSLRPQVGEPEELVRYSFVPRKKTRHVFMRVEVLEAVAVGVSPSTFFEPRRHVLGRVLEIVSRVPSHREPRLMKRWNSIPIVSPNV